MSGIALAPLVVDIKANLLPFSNGIDTASRKGADFERKMDQVNRELKLTESGFKVAGSSAELMGNKMVKLSTKQRELTEKMRLQSRAIDINKEAYIKIDARLQKYIEKNDKLKNSIEKVTRKHQEAERTYGKEAEETKKLADKLTNLNEKLANNKKKIEATNEKLDKQKTKLNEWQTELLQSQQALNKTNKEIKEFKLTQMSENLGKVSNGLKTVGSNLTTHVSLPLAGIATIAAHTGMEFEEKMSRVKAISGATGEQFKLLTDQALKLGQETAFSASECAEGMENLASAGFDVNETTEAMPGLLDLAASSGEDLATSSEIAASTLRGFGLEASRTGHVADVLAKNAAATNAAVKDTGDAMKYIAPNARAAGLSLEETTAAIGELANAGIKGSQAGTTLRSALVRLAKPSDPAATAMERIGFTAFNSSGKMKSLATIMGELNEKTKNLTDEQKQNTIATIFGTEALSGMTVLMQGGKQGLTDLTNQFKNCDGAASEMAKTMQDNTKASIEQAGGALETASIKMLNIVAPAIKSIADDIGDLTDKFSALTPETQQVILKLGAVAIAAGPLLSITGKLTGGFVKLVDFTKKFKTALSATEAVAKTTTVATEGLATATTASSAASGAAALSLGSVASVALPLVGVIGAVAGGVYLYTKNTEVMSSSALKSKEDLGLVGNALLALHGQYALTTDEMDKMNIKHKEWSDKISPETQKSLTALSDKVATLKFDLAHTNGLDGVISEGDINNLKQRTNRLFDEAIAKIKERAPEIQKEMAEAFKADDGKLDEDEKKLMEFFNKSQSQQIEKINELSKEANSIYDKAAKEHRDISKDEQNDINKLLDEAAKIQMDNTVKNNDELLAAQANFNARLQSLDMNGVSNLLQEKAKARDKEVQIQSEKYDTLIQKMKMKMPEMNEEQKKYAQKEIDKWTETKNKAVGTERDKYKGFLKAAREKYPELVNYIDEANGKILDEGEKTKKKELEQYSQGLDGLNKVTKSGYYQVYNKVRGSMDDIYVEVDDSTGEVVELWDKKTNEILGKPIKARDDIKNELKSGKISFTPIVSEYNKNKDAVENNPVKPRSEENKGLFDWVKDAWRDNVQYVIDHPIKSFTDWVGGSIQKAPNFHYNGLENVPFDGYLARLHKGERVLTAEENNSYNKSTGDIRVTNNFYGRVDSPYEVSKATKRSMRELQY